MSFTESPRKNLFTCFLTSQRPITIFIREILPSIIGDGCGLLEELLLGVDVGVFNEPPFDAFADTGASIEVDFSSGTEFLEESERSGFRRTLFSVCVRCAQSVELKFFPLFWSNVSREVVQNVATCSFSNKN